MIPPALEQKQVCRAKTHYFLIFVCGLIHKDLRISCTCSSSGDCLSSNTQQVKQELSGLFRDPFRIITSV